MKKIISYWFKNDDSVKEKPVKSIAESIDGKRLHGKSISYYPRGELFAIMNFKNGRLHGEYKEFYMNGQIKIDTNYINGRIDGYEKEYDENGNILSNDFFVNGVRND